MLLNNEEIAKEFNQYFGHITDSLNFKSLNNINPEFIWSHFVFKNITYNRRKGPLLRLSAAKSTAYEINSVLFRVCLCAYVLISFHRRGFS